MQRTFGSGNYVLPKIIDRNGVEHDNTTLSDAAKRLLLENPPTKNVVYLTNAILYKTALELKAIRENNESILRKAKLFYADPFDPLEPETTPYGNYFRINLDTIPKTPGTAFEIKDTTGKCIARIINTFTSDNLMIYIDAHAPLIIDGAEKLPALKVFNSEAVLLDNNFEVAGMLLIHATDIIMPKENPLSISAGQIVFHSEGKSELHGNLDAVDFVHCRTGTYVGHVNIKAENDDILIIAEHGDQYGSLDTKKMLTLVGITENHPTAKFHGTVGINIITPGFVDDLDASNEPKISTNHFAMRVYNALLKGQKYIFAGSTNIIADHAIKAAQHTKFYLNNLVLANSGLSTRLKGQIIYSPDVSVSSETYTIPASAEEENIPLLPRAKEQGGLTDLLPAENKPLPLTTNKRSINLLSDEYLEVANLNVTDAEVNLKSKYWVLVTGNINSHWHNNQFAMHIQAKNIVLNNIHTDLPLIIGDAQTLTQRVKAQTESIIQYGSIQSSTTVQMNADNVQLESTADLSALNLQVSGTNKIQFESDSKVTVENILQVTEANTFKNYGKINGNAVVVSVKKFLLNGWGGSIDAENIFLSARTVCAIKSLYYGRLEITSAFACVTGYTFGGQSNINSLLSFTPVLSVQNIFRMRRSNLLKSAAIALGNITLIGAHFVISPVIATGLQLLFNSAARAIPAYYKVKSLSCAINGVVQDGSELKFYGLITAINQTAIFFVMTGLSLSGAYHHFTDPSSVADAIPLPFDLKSFGHDIEPYVVSLVPGPSNTSLIEVNAGVLLGLTSNEANLVNLNLGFDGALAETRVSFLGVDASLNGMIGWRSDVSYLHVTVGGDTKTLLGNTNVQAYKMFLIAPAFDHRHWNINTAHLSVRGGPTTLTQSSVSGGEMTADAPLTLDHQTVINSIINANAPVTINASVTNAAINANAPVTINASLTNGAINANAPVTINASQTNAEINANAPVIINESQIKSKINAEANMEIIKSETQGDVTLAPDVSLRADASKLIIPVLTLGQNAQIDLDDSQVIAGSTINHGGVIGGNDSSFTTQQIDQQGQLNFTNSIVSVEQATGDMSSHAVHTDHTTIYTPDQGNTYDVEQKKNIDDLMDYCATNQRYPTAEQWYSQFNHNPTQQEIAAYNKMLSLTFSRDSHYKPLSNQEYADFKNHLPHIQHGVANATNLFILDRFKDQLLAGKSFLAGATIVPHVATAENIDNFFTDKKDLQVFYWNGILYYIYPDTKNISNRNFYNIVPMQIQGQDLQLSGNLFSLNNVEVHASNDLSTNNLNFNSSGPIGLFAQHNLNLNNSMVTSQSNLTAYATNTINLTASHLRGSTTLVQGNHGVNLEPSVTTQTDRSSGWHGLKYKVDHTTTTIITPSSVTATHGNLYILAPDGTIISHGTNCTSPDKIYFDGDKGVLLWDVRGTTSHTSHSFSLTGYERDKTVNTFSEPSHLATDSNVYLHSAQGTVNVTGAQFEAPNGNIYISAHEVVLNRPLLEQCNEHEQIGLVDVRLPSTIDMANTAATTLLTNAAPALTATETIGRRAETETTQKLGPGSMTAQQIYIDADRVDITNNYGINADTLHVHADVLNVNGATLHTVMTAEQDSVSVTENILTGDPTNISLAHANSTASETVHVNAQLNVRELDLQVGTLNLITANIDPPVITGHVDTMNIISPIDSSTTSSASETGGVGLTSTLAVDSGSLSYSHSQSHHETISHPSSLNPADASGFTVGTISNTDANVGSNMQSLHTNDAHQSLVNSNRSINLGASGTSQGISSTQLNVGISYSQHPHNVNIPVGAAIVVLATAVNQLSMSRDDQSAQNISGGIDNNKDSDWGYSGHDYRDNDTRDDDYGDDDHSHITKSELEQTQDISQHTTSKTPTSTVKARSNVDDVRDGMFTNQPAALQNLFPELLDDTTNQYSQSYLSGIARGVEAGGIKAITTPLSFISDTFVLLAGSEARKGRVGNGEACEPQQFNCTLYNNSKTNMRERINTVITTSSLGFDALYVPETNTLAYFFPEFDSVKETGLHQSANRNLHQLRNYLVFKYDDFMSLSGPNKAEETAEIITEIVISPEVSKGFEELSNAKHYEVLLTLPTLKSKASHPRISWTDLHHLALSDISDQMNVNNTYGFTPDSSVDNTLVPIAANFEANTNIETSKSLSALIGHSLFKPSRSLSKPVETLSFLNPPSTSPVNRGANTGF